MTPTTIKEYKAEIVRFAKLIKQTYEENNVKEYCKNKRLLCYKCGSIINNRKNYLKNFNCPVCNAKIFLWTLLVEIV